MKVVIQRVSQAQVAIEEQIVGQIKQGFTVVSGQDRKSVVRPQKMWLMLLAKSVNYVFLKMTKEK